MTRASRSAVLAAAIAGSLFVAGCGGGGGTNQSSGGKTITMLVSGYMFDSTQFMNQYSSQITKEWDAKYPTIKLQVIKIAGTDVDEADALALRFKQASTTPDVVVTETPYLSQYAAAGYLLPVDKYLSSASSAPFWSTFAQNIKDLTKYNGTEYGVSAGNNDQGLLYNKQMLQQAGVPVPWNPKSWADILSAAEAVKAHDPGVTPLWLGAGVQAGPFNVGQGVANLLFGTSTPTMYDQSTKKWVVSSPGLTSSLNFYKQVYSQGLGASTSELFTTDAIGSPVNLMKQQKLAITLASNWMPEAWVTPGTSFYWPQSSQLVGVAPIPTETGQAPGIAGEISGWALAVSKASGNPTAAWNLVKMNLETTNQLDMALWSGFVPPSSTVANLPKNLEFAAPFQAAFNNYLQYGQPLPSNESFTVYARGLNQATGTLAQSPDTPMSTVLSSLSSSVSQQLGPQAIETKGLASQVVITSALPESTVLPVLSASSRRIRKGSHMAPEMPPLIITATPNKSWLNPDLPYPLDIDAVAVEAARCVANGASILHLHSVTEWVPMIAAVRAVAGDALVQCGMSSMLLDERLDIFEQGADMISIIASHHAEAFPEADVDVLHPVAELLRYCELCIEHNVRPEFEIWHSGSIWNLEYLLAHTELTRPVINTLFFGWPGGTWSPPTIDEYLNRRRLMPPGCAVTVSVMGPERYGILAAAITSGDHVRVGTEDYGYTRWGEPAQASDLVGEIVVLAEALGRPVASPSEARKMLAFEPAR